MIFSPEQLRTSNNQYKTSSLFKETNLHNPKEAIMTLKDSLEGNTLPSLKTYYVSLTLEDPSEYVFASEVFGSFTHWNLIKNSKFIQPYYKDYVMNAEAKRKSLAFKKIVEEAKGGKYSFTASKYLIEEPWKDKKSKEVKEASKKSTEKAFQTVSKDAERLKEYLQ